jgi:hypothetical protein
MRFETSLRRMLVSVVLTGTFAMQLAQANNLTFLKQSPIAAFTGEDYDLMTRNVDAVLTNAKMPAKSEWRNPQTGNSGTAEALLEFSGPKGERCKRLRVVNKAGSRDSRATYTLCRNETGWHLASSDYAPVPKANAPASATK